MQFSAVYCLNWLTKCSLYHALSVSDSAAPPLHSTPLHSTALDPLFWVAHGALERMFQKAIFSGMFEETVYDTVSHCSGHNAVEKKAWLDGYHFIDQSIITSDLTNSELTVILDPKSNEYRDLINFVYDVAEFEWCEDASQWFPESA